MLDGLDVNTDELLVDYHDSGLSPATTLLD